MPAVAENKKHIAGEAGRSGPDVRSDLHVHFEVRDEGGIHIELRSRVETYYGDAIRAQVHAVLHQLGVRHAAVSIVDEGALPFVIAARVEAAVRRANMAVHKPALPEATPLAPASHKDRLRRSRLYLPGNEPKYFINAALHAPDAVILDLEDSVHFAEKDAARLLVRNALRAVDFGAAERMVRINQLPLGMKDLEEIVPQSPDLVLIPKVENAGQVEETEAAIESLRERAGIVRPIWLMPILESALGIENAFDIATCSDHIAGLTLGLEDYTADLGVAKTREGAETLYARMRVVNAAHAAHVQAIDSVFGDVADSDGLLQWGERSRAMGFEGMGCVHPSQIEIIHRAFAPSAQELEKAQRIVAAYQEAQARGLGVVSLGSKMIDAPVVHRALKLVKRAEQMGLDAVHFGHRRGETMSATAVDNLTINAAGRRVPTSVNGREQIAYQGVNGYAPEGVKAAPPIRSNRDYPANGDKRVADSRSRAGALRAARRHDHQQPSSSAQRRPRRADRAANRGAHGRAATWCGSPAHRFPATSR